MHVSAFPILPACALTIVLVAGSARAQTQDLEAMRQVAETFARAQTRSLHGEVVIEAGTLDSRVRLGACQSLQPYLPAGGKLWGHSNVGVRCQHPETWSIIVPVVVRVMADALYAARPLSRGAPVTDQDVTTRRVDITQLPAGVLMDRTQAVGRIPSVSMAAGLPLRATLSATFREHTPKGFGELLKNLASPDIDHAHQVLEGEHLTRIVNGVYKTPAYYMAVAEANCLDTVRALRPGSAIYLPPVR